MDGFTGHQLICRACLRIVESKNQSFGFIEDANGNLKDMIMCCVPEMVNKPRIVCASRRKHVAFVFLYTGPFRYIIKMFPVFTTIWIVAIIDKTKHCT